MIKVASGEVQEASITAVVIRADGRVENLGVVAYHHKSPWKRLLWRVSRLLKRI